MPRSDMQLGVRENFGQFALLVVVNAFVGSMVCMERSILSAIAETDFHLGKPENLVVAARVAAKEGTGYLAEDDAFFFVP